MTDDIKTVKSNNINNETKKVVAEQEEKINCEDFCLAYKLDKYHIEWMSKVYVKNDLRTIKEWKLELISKNLINSELINY